MDKKIWERQILIALVASLLGIVRRLWRPSPSLPHFPSHLYGSQYPARSSSSKSCCPLHPAPGPGIWSGKRSFSCKWNGCGYHSSQRKGECNELRAFGSAVRACSRSIIGWCDQWECELEMDIRLFRWVTLCKLRFKVVLTVLNYPSFSMILTDHSTFLQCALPCSSLLPSRDTAIHSRNRRDIQGQASCFASSFQATGSSRSQSFSAATSSNIDDPYPIVGVPTHICCLYEQCTLVFCILRHQRHNFAVFGG